MNRFEHIVTDTDWIHVAAANAPDRPQVAAQPGSSSLK